MRLPWQRVEWLQYGTMLIRPDAIDFVRETGEDGGCALEVGLRSGTTIFCGVETAELWKRWLASAGRKQVVARWNQIPNHPNSRKVQVFCRHNYKDDDE